MRSKSVLGLSSIRLIFARGTDLLIARQLVQERLATVAPTLPVNARPPQYLAAAVVAEPLPQNRPVVRDTHRRWT